MNTVMKFSKIELTRLRNAEHIAMMDETLALVQTYGAETLKCKKQSDALAAALAEEKAVESYRRRSELTEQIVADDRERDRFFSGMREVVRGYQKHFDPAVVEAANTLAPVFNDYRNAPHDSYGANTAAIDAFLAALAAPKYVAPIATLDLAGWLTRLSEINAAFAALVAARDAESDQKPAITTAEARAATDAAFYALTSHIEGLQEVEADKEKYHPFVQAINAMIDRYRRLTEQHHAGKTDIAPAIVAPIAPQAHTGKPVTVIPEVSLRNAAGKTVELYLGIDFDVRFHNSVNIGNATLTIRGIGAYTGQKTVSFNIVKE